MEEGGVSDEGFGMVKVCCKGRRGRRGNGGRLRVG